MTLLLRLKEWKDKKLNPTPAAPNLGRSGSKEYIFTPSPTAEKHKRQKQSRVKWTLRALDCFYRLCFEICGDGEYKIFRPKNKNIRARSKSKDCCLRLLCIGFTPYGFLLYICNTAFFKWAWFAFSCVVLAMLAVAIFHAPMLKFIVYACTTSILVVHKSTPPVFVIKSSQ